MQPLGVLLVNGNVIPTGNGIGRLLALMAWFFIFLVCVRAVFFEDQADPANKSFFSEIISSVSDVKFSHDGMYFFARDNLTIKVCRRCCEHVRFSCIPADHASQGDAYPY